MAKVAPNIIVHRKEASSTTAMDSTLLASVCDQDPVLQIDTVSHQMRSQHVASEDHLGLSFREQVESSHQLGLPPITFFSQTSPRE